MNIAALSGAIGLVTTLGGGGYWIATELTAKADHQEVLAVNSKADYIIDKQMESTLSQINRLEAKTDKTQDDRDQIKYLREELERSRQIRQQR